MTARASDLANLPAWPRLLSPVQAAAYVGMSVTLFERMFPDLPKVPLNCGRVFYDKAVIDKYLDKLSGLSVAPSEEDDVGDFLGDLPWEKSK